MTVQGRSLCVGLWLSRSDRPSLARAGASFLRDAGCCMDIQCGYVQYCTFIQFGPRLRLAFGPSRIAFHARPSVSGPRSRPCWLAVGQPDCPGTN